MSMDAAGRRIAYSVFAERSNVWSVPVPAQPPVGLTDAVPVTSGNQIVESFDISPDGRWLAYDSDRSGIAQIYRVPVSGGEPEQLTTDFERPLLAALDAGRARDLPTMPSGKADAVCS